MFIWFFCFSFFHRTQWKGRTKGASILTAISPAKPNCSDRELMSDLHSNKLGNIDYESMFADRKADGLDDSDEEGDAPHFNFVGSNPPPKPKYVWGVPHGCDITPELQRAARQQKERDKDDSKAGGDKFFFWCLFFGFFSLVFLVFFLFVVWTMAMYKKMVVLWQFLFFFGGGCDDDYNTIIDCNLKNRFCIAVCIAVLSE